MPSSDVGTRSADGFRAIIRRVRDITTHPPSPPPRLRRSLSLTLTTLYGLGTILGAGIYSLIGEVAGSAGMYAPVAFLVAALIAGFTGLTYAETVNRSRLSSRTWLRMTRLFIAGTNSIGEYSARSTRPVIPKPRHQP